MKLTKVLTAAALSSSLSACLGGGGYEQQPSGAMYPQSNGDTTMVYSQNGERMWCKTDVTKRGTPYGNQVVYDPSRGNATQRCTNYPPNNQGYDDPYRRANTTVRDTVYTGTSTINTILGAARNARYILRLDENYNESARKFNADMQDATKEIVEALGKNQWTPIERTFTMTAP